MCSKENWRRRKNEPTLREVKGRRKEEKEKTEKKMVEKNLILFVSLYRTVKKRKKKWEKILLYKVNAQKKKI